MGLGCRGNYSMVRQAFNRCTGCQYACKIINARKFADQPIVLRAFEREPNIVSFIDFYSNDETYWIIMEYVSGGDLNKYFDMKPVPEESEVKHLTRQICEAVRYMHERGFVHRDIKPDNILLASRDRGLVKLSDLGS
ncbi:kinase-like domain-containing protein [Jimgerdemannia flammicorona]|uniref:Kinase-like domain-containing protein n=1 Tax=Jimgerdemannia flammicorona TaxID=994334 RepID=A0A433Q9F2_9FUNG|nr:kinase-like domain-containing protein [Jimgerdemannia flammicorona]